MAQAIKFLRQGQTFIVFLFGLLLFVVLLYLPDGLLSSFWRGCFLATVFFGGILATLYKGGLFGKAFEKCQQDTLQHLVEIGLESSEILILFGKMKQAVDISSTEAQSMASAVEEMVTSINQISERTKSVSDDSQNAEKSANNGVSLAQEGVRSMKTISETTSEASKEVNLLSEESERIGGIVAQIRGIAEQTNLLALNATIEAARAGESGKGFAVVASEVKTLATQTSRATEDIEKRITDLHTRMEAIIASMGNSTNAVAQGEDVIQKLGSQLEEISTQVGGVNNHMGEIAAILTQQTAASNDVSKGIGLVAEAAQENEKGISSTLDQMDNLSKIVNDQINDFAHLGGKAILEVAKNDHITFKKNIADVLIGRKSLNASSLPDHHTCRFGSWYDKVKEDRILNLQSFKEILDPHKRVHQAGKQVLEFKSKADNASAMKAMDELTTASHDVVMALDKMIKESQ